MKNMKWGNFHQRFFTNFPLMYFMFLLSKTRQ